MALSYWQFLREKGVSLMSDDITKLKQEIATLKGVVDSLASMPNEQKAMMEKLSEKQALLAKLTGEKSEAGTNMTSTTNIHGNVHGPVMSGNYTGPVHVGGTTVNEGPHVTGPITAGRDFNLAREQTINNSGDSIRVGDISGSNGIAIGRGAKADVRNVDERKGTFVSGDQFNLSGDFKGSILNIKSTLSNVSQSIGASGTIDQTTADQLKKLVDQLSAELQTHAAQSPEGATELAKRTEIVVAEATKSKPDQDDVKYSLERFTKAATNIGGVIGTALPIATQIADFIRKMVGL